MDRHRRPERSIRALLHRRTQRIRDTPIGGYGLSSGGLRELQNVTGERWRLASDRACGQCDIRGMSVRFDRAALCIYKV